MKPSQLMASAAAVTQRETHPITASIRSALWLRRRLASSCHSVIPRRSGGKKKFKKALGTNNTRKLITNSAVKMVGR